MALPSASLLPISSALPRLTAALASHRIVVLEAPPGSGKTTVAPLALLDEPWLAGRTILILEPRRLAARMAADRMASLLAESTGQTVGYRIRFERRISAATRIEVLTEGILTRRLQNDPGLDGVGLVIFDEFHERSLNSDLALALALDAQAGLREDLRILIMSATLDTERLADLLPGATIVSASGRAFPVEIRYREGRRPTRTGYPTATGYESGQAVAAVASTIRLAAPTDSGDILAFLPGGPEIRAVVRDLAPWARDHNVRIEPLYADLPKNLQDRAVQPSADGRRRVVLATSIAETSLTIEGITVVIDSGWTRTPRFDPNSGLTRLTTIRVSKAAASQRAGRAGRLSPGVCYRLMPESQFATLLDQTGPEILNADLAPLLLDLANWGVNDPGELFWLDPLPPGNLAQARETLVELDAVDHRGRITDLGRRLATLPLHPRLGRLLLFAAEHGQAQLGAELAALLAERDILRNANPRPTDMGPRLQALAAFRQGDKATMAGLGGDPAACARVEQASRQFLNLVHSVHPVHQVHADPAQLLLLAFPERLAQLRPGSRNRYLLAAGRGARLTEDDHLGGHPYLIAPELDAGEAEGRIYLAAALDPETVRQTLSRHIITVADTFWDREKAAVSSKTEERFLKLTLSSRPLAAPDHEAVRQALLDGIRDLGLEALPWTRETRDFQARVQCLKEWQPEADWPDLSDRRLHETLADWLGPFLNGLTSRTDLARLDLAAILRGRLDWPQSQRLGREAPTHFTAPSGSRIKITYAPGQPPVLAVRLQEMFGLVDTPRLGLGRIPVLLHLLSPAQRPIQITQDLQGFWNTTYREVRKELQGRYPKHHWPEDPWTARPTARTKKAL